MQVVITARLSLAGRGLQLKPLGKRAFAGFQGGWFRACWGDLSSAHRGTGQPAALDRSFVR